MGWDSNGTRYYHSPTKAERVADVRTRFTNFDIVKDTMVGNVYCGVYRSPEYGVFATVALTEYDPDSGELLVKTMSEDEGPCYYDFPVTWLSYLDAPANEYSAAWREEVVRHHDAKKAHRASVAVPLREREWEVEDVRHVDGKPVRSKRAVDYDGLVDYLGFDPEYMTDRGKRLFKGQGVGHELRANTGGTFVRTKSSKRRVAHSRANVFKRLRY